MLAVLAASCVDKCDQIRTYLSVWTWPCTRESEHSPNWTQKVLFLKKNVQTQFKPRAVNVSWSTQFLLSWGVTQTSVLRSKPCHVNSKPHHLTGHIAPTQTVGPYHIWLIFTTYFHWKNLKCQLTWLYQTWMGHNFESFSLNLNLKPLPVSV